MNRFTRRADPHALSIRDVLEARDHYHVHIANLDTVIGTAVGRYRIRRDDDNFMATTSTEGDRDLGPRTLRNSDIRDWSWPCVLVFVDDWISKAVLAKHPELAVPPVLYLPDGRQVRTCPILVERREANLRPEQTAVYASSKISPNFQLFLADQGATRMALASAIVEDGASAYALTSRHLLAGATAATPVVAYPRGKQRAFGVTTGIGVDTLPLAEVYPGYGTLPTRLSLDAALVKLNDIGQCDTQYAGVGSIGKMIDMSSDRMSINLVGCPVFTVLPGNNRVEGSVHGLFYRHATIGGIDTVTEFLIGPRQSEAQLETRPGDSGALWFWDELADRGQQPAPENHADASPHAHDETTGTPPPAFRPLAIQWGGHGFASFGGNTTTELALAASVSAVCKALDVGIVQDWGTGQSRYWGKIGHYHIGYAACFALQSDKASALFNANAELIGLSDDDILAGHLPMANQLDKFIPLADVPDLVWRTARKKDQANHFADMDEPGQGEFSGQTLLELWQHDQSSRTPQFWNSFYDSIDPARMPQHRGALPFRVQQLYTVMVEALRQKTQQGLEAYFCAAGVLAHYLGDACQPLHVSYLHHGEPDSKDDDEIHAVYEDDMLNYAREELLVGVRQRVDTLGHYDAVDGAKGAADEAVQLMRRTIEHLAPAEVLQVYNDVRGNKQSAAMWEQLGDRTMDCMADGARTLARIWQSAWTEGGGDIAGHYSLVQCQAALSKAHLRVLYNTKEFAESNWLKDMQFDQ